MALITADRIKTLKANVKAECQRRNSTGSVATYGGTSYDFTTTPATGQLIKYEHYEKNAVPLNKINSSKQPIEGATGSPATEASIKKMEDNVAAFKACDKYANSLSGSGCNASCTGLCFSCTSSCVGGCTSCTGCTGTCTNSCTSCTGCSGGCDGCRGCGSGCASGCSGCGSGCASGCTSCSGCSGCGSGCANTCSACGGGCTATCAAWCTGGGCQTGCTGSGGSDRCQTACSNKVYA